ncbi:FAD/NAD(P)-binding domain-containing protein [Xylariaceae sp. FL1272]|nr:FAD/NAD(P)-binding domain-containing protein [Xylariaceae sp. FL1272]
MPHQLPIIIIGAGLSGLTLAQGLRLHSIPFHVFERRSRCHRLQGHRFRVSNEGQSALFSVLSADLQTLFLETAAQRHRHAPRYVNAKNLDYAAPTLADADTVPPLDRTWILQLLSSHLDNTIEYRKEFSSYEPTGEGVSVKFSDGTVVTGHLLVGADGVKSRVRKQLQPNRRLLDLQRWIIWGRTPLTEALREKLPPDMLTWCMYMDHEDNVQTVVEPMVWSDNVQQVSEGKLNKFENYVYYALCTAPSQYAEKLPQTSDERKIYLQSTTKTWDPALKLLLGSAVHEFSACAPVVSSKPDIEIRLAKETGQVTLIGDAAHAMSPMGGSGADTAVRSAADLAETIASAGVSRQALEGFERRMEERAKERIEHSFRGGLKFWRGMEWSEYEEIDI